jgi:hypothetical protein
MKRNQWHYVHQEETLQHFDQIGMLIKIFIVLSNATSFLPVVIVDTRGVTHGVSDALPVTANVIRRKQLFAWRAFLRDGRAERRHRMRVR